MKSIAEIYCLDLKKRLERFGVWKPGDNIELGDMINIENGVMSNVGNIRELGIDFETETENYDPEAEEEYRSDKEISVRPFVGGSLPGSDKVSLNVEISFKREKSVFYSTKGLKNIRIKNQLQLKQQIERLNCSREWDKAWAVITHLTMADNAVIVITKAANAKVLLNGQCSADINAIKVTDVKLGFDFSEAVGVEFKRKFNIPTPLLFQAKHLKSNLFSKDKFVKYMIPPKEEPEKFQFVELTDKDWNPAKDSN